MDSFQLNLLLIVRASVPEQREKRQQKGHTIALTWLESCGSVPHCLRKAAFHGNAFKGFWFYIFN